MHQYADRDAWICLHGVSCISTHTEPRQSAAQSAVRTAPLIYPRQQPHRGPNLSALRPRPAPMVAAADQCRECALRDGLARPSRLQRTADERARRRSTAIRAQQSASEYSRWSSAYSPRGTVRTHTCSMRQCACVIPRLDRRRRLRWCRRTCSGDF